MRNPLPILLLCIAAPAAASAQSASPDGPTQTVPPSTPTSAPVTAPARSESTDTVPTTPTAANATPSTSTPAAPSVVAPPAPAVAAPAPGLWPPLASWHNDVFYLRSPDQNWFLVPTGRLQLDAYAFTPGAVTSDYTTSSGAYHRPDLTDGFLLRRARIEVVGGFLGRFTFMLAGEWAGTVQATDLIFNARVHQLLNVQVGQFDAPFTLENRTSDKYLDFLERSIAVRALGIPTNKEIGMMLWGETANRLFYYSVGVFNGDGQNRTNRDNYVDVMGRLFAHPFITMGGLLENVQIGGSFRAGWRGQSVDYPYPNMTTQGGWAFFNSAIVGGANPLTVVPDSLQLGLAAELDVPIRRFDLRGEFIWVQNGTGEVASAAAFQGPAQRLGVLSGFGYYAQVGYWLFGDINVSGRPGYQNPPSLRLETPDPRRSPFGLQALVRFDAVDVRYQSASRSDPSRAAGPADGAYTTYAAEFGINVWWTRHVRFSLNYMEYFFPNRHVGAGATTLDEDHAVGPHGSQPTGSSLAAFGELSARIGLVL